MKKFLYILFSGVLFFNLTSCDDGEQEVEDNEIKLESADYQFRAPGGYGKIVLAPGYVTVKAESNSQDWLHEVTVNGNTITFKVEEFYSVTNRTGVISITSGKFSKNVSITQIGSMVRTGQIRIILADQNANDILDIYSDNLGYTISNSKTWLSYEEISSENGLTRYSITADRNREEINRMDTIKISFKREDRQESLEVPIIQLGTATIDTWADTKWSLQASNPDGVPFDPIELTFRKDTSPNDNRYVVSGLSHNLYFNFTDGSIKFTAGIPVHKYTTDKGREMEIWQLAAHMNYDGLLPQWRHSYYDSFGMIGIMSLEGGTTVCRFQDDGTWGYLTADGFLFAHMTPAGNYERPVDYNHIYGNPVLTLIGRAGPV